MRIIYFLVISVMFCSASSYAITLQETIQIGFDTNPITKANDLRLKAEELNVLGVKLDRLPTGHINYTYALNYYRQTYEGIGTNNDYTQKDWSVGVSARLYDGGAGKNRVCAASKAYEALKATNNSTNALIPDTLGSLANSIFEVYRDIVAANDKINFYEYQKNAYEVLLKYASSQEIKNEVESAILEAVSIGEEQYYTAKKNAYAYENEHVLNPLPPKMDSLLEVAESISIPLTAEEAIQIGLRKNPEIVIAQARLEGAQCALRAQKAEAFSPKVDVDVSRGSSQYDGAFPYKDIGNSANVRVTVPLSPSQVAYTQSERLRVDAILQDLEKEIFRMKNNISGSLYPDLEQYAKNVRKYQKQLEDNERDIKGIFKKLQSNQPVDHRYAMLTIGRRYNLHWNYSMNLNLYVTTKFNIQRKIGTLFDQIDAQKLK